MTEFRPPYAHAAGAAFGAFFLYVLTLAPTTWFWDTSEYIATAHILGIPHPPGNPLFVVVGRVWSLLLAPTGLDVAVRINLLAAVTSALATGFFFLVAYRILHGWIGDRVQEIWVRRMPLVGAWLGALMGATAFTVWNQSNVNEKVYTLSVLGIAAVSWLAIRWADRKDQPGSGWLLVAAVYLMVLGSTNHLMALLPAPALGVLILVEKPRVLLDTNLLTRGVLAVVLALSFNFFLPIRSDQQPIINEGEPVCETLTGAAVAIYTNGSFGCDALAANLTREQYAKPPLSERQAPLGHQLANWFQYFDWQWARGLAVEGTPGNARLPVSLLFLGLGVGGLLLAFRSGPGSGAYLTTLAVTLTLALVYYLNFRYGYSLAPEEIDRTQREVRERDYFFIAGFHLWGFLSAIGLVGLWRWASGGGEQGRGLALAAPILVVAFIPLIFNWAWADRSDDHSARDWAYNVLQSVEPYGIIFTNGDNDTFPLWYLQEVEEIRQDVTVIVVQYLYTQWYPRQLNHHTHPDRQRAFNPEHDPGVYPAPSESPANSITRLSDEEMNQVGSGQIGQEMTVDVGPVAVQFPAGTWLGRGDRLALAIIRDSLGERPIHFASTAGLAQDLGLSRWVTRQGLTARLIMTDLSELDGMVRTSQQVGGDWVDLDTSLALAEEVFSYRGLEERDIWTDRATLNIPWHFYFLYLQLADGAAQAGLPAETVQELRERAERFAVVAQGGSRALQ
jgi:hypothetical protein